MLTGSFTEELFKCLLHSFKRVIHAPPPKDVRTNLQCIKLTRDHKDLLPIVAYRCNKRVDTLEKLGLTPAFIDPIVKKDLRFLDYLDKELKDIHNKQNNHDTWLFFDTSVNSTGFFELREADKGSSIANSSLFVNLTH